MSDRTVTEAVGRGKRARRRTADLGVLLLHSRGEVPLTAHAVPTSATLGRDADAEISVRDPGVSRAHTRLENRGSSLWITDLGSRNGTFLNGKEVPPDGAPAAPGTLIRAGRTLLLVCADVRPYADASREAFEGLLGAAALDGVRAAIRTLAPTKSPILVLGETGTGKEVVARAIHQLSGRSGSFVALNCAAVSKELVDAELFGHTRGAFSGAAGTRAGLFRSADDGTLFLDEVGELAESVQAKLLRALESDEVRAVGEDKTTRVDVRVIAATNRDVDAMVASGKFREDLLYRLAGIRVVLPALRERPEDIPLLVSHFLAGMDTTIDSLALERMLLYAWPGNVRELKHAVLTAAALARSRGDSEISEEDLGQVIAAISEDSESSTDDARDSARVTDALRRTDGDVARAAEMLGSSRSALYETMRRLKIDPRAYRSRRGQ